MNSEIFLLLSFAYAISFIQHAALVATGRPPGESWYVLHVYQREGCAERGVVMIWT